MSRAWVVALLLLSCGPEVPEEKPLPDAPVELSVATLNVLKLRAPPGPERIAREIVGEPVDLIALQEAATGYFGRLHTHEIVRTALGERLSSDAWAGTSGLPGVFLDGLSLFATRPDVRILHSSKERLSWYLTRRHRFLEKRYVQYSLVEIEAGGGAGRLGVLNVHLTHRGETERRPEVDRLLAFADRMRADPEIGAPVQILLGDLNSLPGSGVYSRIGAAGFVDVWAAARPGEDGFTWDERPGGNTEAEGGPPPGARRIDYIFVRPAAVEVLFANVIFDSKIRSSEGPANISDHYGVRADLRLLWR